MELDLQPKDSSKEDTSNKMPAYIIAIFIALSGVAVLFFTVYYIAFLPIPARMEPLRIRVLTALQLEDVVDEDVDRVAITDAEELTLYEEPSEEAATLGVISEGKYYEKLDEEDGWIKIKESELLEGWVDADYVQDLDW